MDFFEHQERAEAGTTRLVVLYALAVLLLAGAMALTAHFVILYADLYFLEERHHLSLVATAAIVTLGVILLGSQQRLHQLRRGGSVVAESLGGRLLLAGSSDLAERRCMNVVEEMAIAAGLPMPAVYVLDRETAINAFAAGWSPDDAVIGVTRGALETLTREELQGVIAHEFSHIQHRDVALNLRALGVLYGIVVISSIGHTLMRLGVDTSSYRRGRRDSSWPLFLFGLAVLLLGSLGAAAARLIQAAISRQREYLADASAAQYTRNPEGLARALARIGLEHGALVHPRSSEVRHMLFSEPRSALLDLGASHPPLEDRIRRLLPHFTGSLEDLLPASAPSHDSLRDDAPRLASETHELEPGNAPASALAGGALGARAWLNGGAKGDGGGAPAASPARLTRAEDLRARIPPRLLEAAESPFSARALLLAWLVDGDVSVIDASSASFGADRALLFETVSLARALSLAPDDTRLPTYDLALGSLAALSDEQRFAYVQIVESFIAAATVTALRSACLAELVRRQLSMTPRPERRPHVTQQHAVEILLSAVAHEGQLDRPAAERAFAAASEVYRRLSRTIRLVPAAELTRSAFFAALEVAGQAPLSARARLYEAAELAAESNGVIAPVEAELLRTLSVCLELPLASRPSAA